MATDALGPGAESVRSELHAAKLVQMLRTMILIRTFDSKLPDLYTKGLIRGSSHAAIGQEAVAVGACAALADGDYITSTHRGHGHVIAKGADVRRMMAELLGRVDGYCRGKGGSMHIADFSIGILGANGIVGGGFGLAAGAALSASIQQEDRVVLCFFGDGAFNQGSFHEVANMASIWSLPLVFVCENNRYAMSAQVESMTSVIDLSRRAEAYSMPGDDIDGMDVLTVYDSVHAAVARARSGNGPSLVVANCYRFEGHFAGDMMRYRDADEAARWKERDPIRALQGKLEEWGILAFGEGDGLREWAEREVQEAVEFGQSSSYPPPEAAWEDVLV